MRVPGKIILVACVLCVLLGMAITGFTAPAQTNNSSATPTATTSSRAAGSSCAHPLEAEKTNPGYRGDKAAFKVSLQENPFEGGAELTLSVKPAKNVEICPYPNGVIYHVAEDYVKLPDGREVPQEHNVRNIPLHFSPHGGTYKRMMTAEPVTTWYFIIRGRYIHPPRSSRG